MQAKKGKKGAKTDGAAEPKPVVTHPTAVKTAPTTGNKAQVRQCPSMTPTGVYAVRLIMP